MLYFLVQYRAVSVSTHATTVALSSLHNAQHNVSRNPFGYTWLWWKLDVGDGYTNDSKVTCSLQIMPRTMSMKGIISADGYFVQVSNIIQSTSTMDFGGISVHFYSQT